MPVIDMAATGARIGALRDAAGITNADIADGLGLTTRNAVYRWLRGETMPSLDNMVILASMLGVGLDDIVVTTIR